MNPSGRIAIDGRRAGLALAADAARRQSKTLWDFEIRGCE